MPCCCGRRRYKRIKEGASAKLTYTEEVSEHNPGMFKEAWFVNARGLKLHAYAATAAWSKARGIVIIHHGIRAHGLFEVLIAEPRGSRKKTFKGSLAELCVSEGFAVYTYDCEGHGLSESTFARGYFSSAWDLVSDLLQFSEIIQKEHPNLPVFLCGGSMGGGICLGAAIRNGDAFRGLILGAPMVSIEQLKKKGANKCLVPIAPCLLRCIPCLRRWRIVAMGVNPNELDRKTNMDDPLTDTETHMLVGPSFACLLYCNELVKSLNKVSVPFLTMHSKEDNIVDFESSQLLMDRTQSVDKTLLEPPKGSDHGIFSQEECRAWTRDTVQQWLTTRI